MKNMATTNSTEVEYLLDAPFLERVVEAVILSVICALAMTGNVSLWIVILRDKTLRIPSNALLLCLSTADILVSAVNMPFTIYTLAQGRWVFSLGGCEVLGFMTMLSFVCSVMSLCTISINRYIHICHHHKFIGLYTWRNTAFFIIGTWLWSVLLSVPPLLGWGEYGYLSGQSFCFCDWKTSISYTFFMVIVCFGGPCSVMCFCYIKILRKVRESKRRIEAFAVGKKHVSTPPSSGTYLADASQATPKTSLIKGNRDQQTKQSESERRKKAADAPLKPISLKSQADIEVHFAPAGMFTSRSSTPGVPEHNRNTNGVATVALDTSIRSKYEIRNISTKVPFDDILLKEALEGGEDNNGQDLETMGPSGFTQKDLLPFPEDLTHHFDGGEPPVSPGPFLGVNNCSKSSGKMAPYQYSPVTCLKTNSVTNEQSMHNPASNIQSHDTSQSTNDRATFHNIANNPSTTTANLSADNMATTKKEPTQMSVKSNASADADSIDRLPVPGSAALATGNALRGSTKTKQALRRKHDEMRMTICLMVVILVFVVCWLPFCITMFWYVFSASPVPRPLNMATLLLGCLNSSCNPIIYGVMNRKFKKGFAMVYCCCCVREGSSLMDSTSL